MIGMIITGHGNFASGLTSSAEWFIGNLDNCVTVDFHIQDAPEVFYDHLLATVEFLSYCDSIIVLSDLVGGVPFQLSAQIANEKKNMQVAGGTNMGMLIEIAVARQEEGMTVEKLADIAVQIGQQQVAKFNFDEVKDVEENKI